MTGDRISGSASRASLRPHQVCSGPASFSDAGSTCFGRFFPRPWRTLLLLASQSGSLPPSFSVDLRMLPLQLRSVLSYRFASNGLPASDQTAAPVESAYSRAHRIPPHVG